MTLNLTVLSLLSLTVWSSKCRCDPLSPLTDVVTKKYSRAEPSDAAVQRSDVIAQSAQSESVATARDPEQDTHREAAEQVKCHGVSSVPSSQEEARSSEDDWRVGSVAPPLPPSPPLLL